MCVFDDSVKISAKEGDSVTLNSGLTEMKDDDQIRWDFENTLIAEINKQADSLTVYDEVLDGRFRDRLKLDKQTGSLTITNITTQHNGDYELLQINYKIFYFYLNVIGEFQNVHTCFLMTKVKFIHTPLCFFLLFYDIIYVAEHRGFNKLNS